MYYTTLWNVRLKAPCTVGWEKLLDSLGKSKVDYEPLSLATILESNGIKDAIWALRAVKGIEDLRRLFAIRCVRQHCQHMIEYKPCLHALDLAELYTVGEATKEDFDAERYEAQGVVRRASCGSSCSEAICIACGAAICIACGDVIGCSIWGERDSTLVVAKYAARGSSRGVAWAWRAIEADFKAIFCED